MVSEIVGLVGTLSNLISGIVSNNSHEKTQEELQKMADERKIAGEWNQAEGIMRDQANKGLAGYETYKSDIQSELPTTMNQIKDYMTGGQMVDALTGLYTKQNQSLRNLDVANENALTGNRKDYATFLQSKAGATTRNMDTQQMLELMKLADKTQGTQDNLNFANRGAEGLDVTKLLATVLQSGGLDKLIAGAFADKEDGGIGSSTSWRTDDTFGNLSKTKYSWLKGINTTLYPQTPSEATFE